MTRTKKLTFGERIIAGLQDAIAIERGEMKAPKVTRRRVTAREATGTRAPSYSKTKIKQLRSSLGLSQPVFAKALNVSAATVRAWEIGQKEPSGPSLRLLEWAGKHPELIAESVRAR